VQVDPDWARDFRDIRARGGASPAQADEHPVNIDRFASGAELRWAVVAGRLARRANRMVRPRFPSELRQRPTPQRWPDKCLRAELPETGQTSATLGASQLLEELTSAGGGAPIGWQRFNESSFGGQDFCFYFCSSNFVSAPSLMRTSAGTASGCCFHRKYGLPCCAGLRRAYRVGA